MLHAYIGKIPLILLLFWAVNPILGECEVIWVVGCTEMRSCRKVLREQAGGRAGLRAMPDSFRRPRHSEDLAWTLDPHPAQLSIYVAYIYNYSGCLRSSLRSNIYILKSRVFGEQFWNCLHFWPIKLNMSSQNCCCFQYCWKLNIGWKTWKSLAGWLPARICDVAH